MAAGILIVEVEIRDHRRIYEHRALGGRGYPMADDPARKLQRHGAARQPQSDLRRRTVVRGDGTGETINDEMSCRADNFLRQLIEFKIVSEVGDLTGKVVHSELPEVIIHHEGTKDTKGFINKDSELRDLRVLRGGKILCQHATIISKAHSPA
jgi:hypothetical protein